MTDDLYHQAIVALARTAEQHPRLEAPDATVTLDNPLCGDRITLDVVLAGTTIERVGQRVRGCLLCEAAGALIASATPGQTAADVGAMRAKVAAVLKADDSEAAAAHLTALGKDWAELEVFLPVRGYKSRHECVLLPFEALRDVLETATKET